MVAFDWEEYFKLAKFMAGQGVRITEGARLRCATSKSYFSAFCIARNYARENLNFSPGISYKDHERLRKHYKEFSQTQIAKRLDRLRQWRNSCDYDDEIDDLQLISSKAIENAQNVIGVINKWKRGSPNPGFLSQ